MLFKDLTAYLDTKSPVAFEGVSDVMEDPVSPLLMIGEMFRLYGGSLSPTLTP